MPGGVRMSDQQPLRAGGSPVSGPSVLPRAHHEAPRSPRGPALTTRPASDGARLDAHREPQRSPRDQRPTVPAWTLTASPSTTRPASDVPGLDAHREAPALTTRRASTCPPGRASRGPRAHHERRVDKALAARRRRESLPFGARRPCPFARLLERSVGANLCPLARPLSFAARLLARGVRALSCVQWRAASARILRLRVRGIGANSPARVAS
jgi:hypothetical protein